MSQSNKPAWTPGINSVKPKIPRGVLRMLITFQRRRDRVLIWILVLSVVAHYSISKIIDREDRASITIALSYAFKDGYYRGAMALSECGSDSTWSRKFKDLFIKDSINFVNRIR